MLQGLLQSIRRDRPVIGYEDEHHFQKHGSTGKLLEQLGYACTRHGVDQVCSPKKEGPSPRPLLLEDGPPALSPPTPESKSMEPRNPKLLMEAGPTRRTPSSRGRFLAALAAAVRSLLPFFFFFLVFLPALASFRSFS